jgi:hypothetical protein
MPQVLRANNIPFHCIQQRPGDYVFTFPGAYHMVINTGQNWAEAVNFCMPQWRHFVPEVECNCNVECNNVRSKFKSHSVGLPLQQEYVGEPVKSRTVVDDDG